MATIGALSGSQQAITTETRGTIGREGFLKLLINQLRHQDPLDPVKNTDFIAQMAQLTSLEQLQDLNKNLGYLVSLQELSRGREDLLFAASLLGREVAAKNPGTGEIFQGQVRGYHLKEGEIWLMLPEQEFPAGWVYKIEVNLRGDESQ